MNALKKVEKLFKSFQKKKIKNTDSNLRPIAWKAQTLTARPLSMIIIVRLKIEFNKHKHNLKAGSLSKFIRLEK
jgi:hypothetical protein